MDRKKVGIEIRHSLREFLIAHAGMNIDQADHLAVRYSQDNMWVDWVTFTGELGEWVTFSKTSLS